MQEIVVGSNMDKIYIVMDFVEHDLKALMETMTQPFLAGNVKIAISMCVLKFMTKSVVLKKPAIGSGIFSDLRKT